jgi:uncharacterized protein involved in exopolysaccharide biosynthesis
MTTEEQLEAAKTKLTALEQRYTAVYPDVIATKRLVRDLEAQLNTETRSRTASASPTPPAPAPAPAPDPPDATRDRRLRELRAQVQSIQDRQSPQQREEARLQRLIASFETRESPSSSRDQELAALTRDYTTLKDTYDRLRAKVEEAPAVAPQNDRPQEGELFRILDPPKVPSQPFSPDRLRINTIASIAGFLVGVAMIIAGAFADSSFRSDVDVFRILQVPVLALVPVMRSDRERRRQRRQKLVLAVAMAIIVVAGAGTYAAWKLQVF